MKRAQLVKEIFWELRAAGLQGSARDLLRAAHFIIRSHAGEIGRAGDFGRVVDSRALPLLAVDVVMNGDPWRVLEFEMRRNSIIDVDAS